MPLPPRVKPGWLVPQQFDLMVSHTIQGVRDYYGK